MKNLIMKVKKLGFRLGIKKLIGYEAIFTWAFRKRTIGKELYQEQESGEAFSVFPHSDRYWYADPLIYEYNNKEAVFMECLNREKKRGAIGVVEISGDTVTSPRIVIEENFHMSFPYIFEWNHVLYMLPETEMNCSIVLYRCREFPYEWEKIGEFLPGHKIVDSIVENMSEDKVMFIASEYRPDDDFYTRFCRYEMCYQNGNLHMEYKGPVTEEYSLESRMAGPLINYNILPIQRSTSGIYGYSIKFKRWEDGKVAECLKEVLPNEIALNGYKYRPIGVHTYSRTSNYELIDIQYLVFNKDKWKNKLGKSSK